jgi:zinc transport system ATP-binding protein
VSLAVEPGEFLALIGPNGGGKTTLLRLILGLLQPASGTVRVFGKTPGIMNRHIGYVPQFSTLRLDFPASVMDMVLMGAAGPSSGGGRWLTGKAGKTQAMEYLDTLGIADCARLPVSALSGGQRQRALVARALMSKPIPDAAHSQGSAALPFLLLLDEPTASIDPQGKFCFYEFLGKLRKRITLIVVSHDVFMLSSFFSGIAVVNNGITRLEGSELTPENLTVLFGRHLHDCPVADRQHAGKALHQTGCTHPVCAEKDSPPSSAPASRPPAFSTRKQDR